MGHARCGGIRALLGDIRFEDSAGQFIAPWMSIAEAAIPPSVAGGPRLDPIGEAAIPPSVAGGPRLDPIGDEARREAMVTHSHGDAEVRAVACEQAAVRVSLENLSSFPFVREAVAASRLQLHGWYFDLGRGELLGCDRDSGRFRPLVPGRALPA
jgi:carbonic anhydrase